MTNRIVPEKEIEKILRDEVKRAGGIAYKLASPGNAGVPDRIVCLPGGAVIFAEVKTHTGVPTDLQKRQIRRLELLDQDIWVIYGLLGLESFFDDYGLVQAAAKVAKRIARGEV